MRQDGIGRCTHGGVLSGGIIGVCVFLRSCVGLKDACAELRYQSFAESDVVEKALVVVADCREGDGASSG